MNGLPARRVTGHHLARRPEAALFILTLGVYVYFYQAGGWNQNSRFDLVRAIVERHTLTIDAYHENTGDKALVRGHYYSDKAPGVSLLALPVHLLAHALRPDLRETDRFQAASSYACTVWAVGLPSALAVLALYRLLVSLAVPRLAAASIAVAYALGTLAFPYSTLLYGHQTSAALVFIAFTVLARARAAGSVPIRPSLLGAGVLLGCAIVVEYTAVLAVLVILGYAVAVVRPWHGILWLAAGLLGASSILLVYHTLAFGSPLALAYSFSIQQPRHRGVFMGLGTPSGRAVYYLLVHEYRGLFYGSPWLLLAVPGALAWWRGTRFRAEALACATLPLLYLTLNASLSDWHGGWGMGPRHLVPALPFLAVLAAGIAACDVKGTEIRRKDGRRVLFRLAAPVCALLVAFSVFMMLVGTAVKPEVPRAVERPFQAFLFPAFFEGRLAINTQSIDMLTGRGHLQRRAWNVGEFLGLEGRATLLPLALYVAAALWWLVVALRARGRASDTDRS